jgi:serine protease Do
MRFVANAVVQVATDKAIGSGVVVSPQGHILTNYHVIKDAASVAVGWSSPMADHATYPPPTVGMPTGVMYMDPDRDLALLAPPWGREFAPITCASDWDEAVEVQEGDFGKRVWAQGSPLGLSGWVSPLVANGLTNIDGKKYIGLSGAINPGNSGGPLYNGDGHLIGLVVAKLADVTIEGIGLGIPLGDILALLRSHGVEPVMAG